MTAPTQIVSGLATVDVVGRVSGMTPNAVSVFLSQKVDFLPVLWHSRPTSLISHVAPPE